jgi:hypothetical protein
VTSPVTGSGGAVGIRMGVAKTVWVGIGVSVAVLVGSGGKVTTVAVDKEDLVSSGSLNDGLTASVTLGSTVEKGGEEGAIQPINAYSVTTNAPQRLTSAVCFRNLLVVMMYCGYIICRVQHTLIPQ